MVIIIGIAATLLLAAALLCLAWFCNSFLKNTRRRKNSETGSSDPSALAEWNYGGGSGSAAEAGGLSGGGGPRQFSMEELQQATGKFDQSMLIGYGSFGSVYKGLLRDGTVVAIKTRPGRTPHKEFIAEVCYLLEIHHRNLVSLLGYCVQGGFQMLVFEYMPNGSISNHLYQTNSENKESSTTKLEFKRRISIALDAAKGLCHLHSLKPPLVHNNFKSSNVLVDENFIAKVADAGIVRLLDDDEATGPSPTSASAFQDPERRGESRRWSEMNDVYSFGVFLLELVTGVEAPNNDSLMTSHGNLFQWVESRQNANNLVDPRLVGKFSIEGMRDFIRLTLLCIVLVGNRRPKMEMVVVELEKIRQKEMLLTNVMGEQGGTSTITPGSQLFTN